MIPFYYLPGQFLTLHLALAKHIRPSAPTRWHRRPPGVIESSIPLTKCESHGLVSRFLHDEMRVGDDVRVEAPNGTFTFNGAQADSVALIGAGVGITPMMSVARYLAETGWPGKVSLILGFRAPRDFIFREELEALQARTLNLSVTVTMSKPGSEQWSGRRGHIDPGLLASVEDIARRRVHVRGHPP